MLAIRLPEEVEKRLAAMAKKSGRTKTFYAREAILNYLEDLEDIYLAEKAMDKFIKSGSKTHSLDEVMNDLGMDTRVL